MRNKSRQYLFVFRIIIIALFACSIISCKKDYPDDIPYWLKEYIREMKKHDDYVGYKSAGSMKINEWERNGEKIYEFHYSSDYNPSTTFHDFEGNYMCQRYWWRLSIWGEPGAEITDSCYDCDIFGYRYSRYIYNSGHYGEYQPDNPY